ncbi:group II intron maturase-specific domain-containing protein [Alicyclobacillus macrosporangiidus]|uniref:Group II intron, maturase-specific domain n=1 Tax=Alicyclobacillus macrosporangiidus TaxID=392015 RepID=A0A1I7LK79_9BACL|nr:group II intron maturase-specific domain-containing protein [Alicyclobacillus macrosporangiidus]SFV10043.1 Group II intron, maturase-specific domain [Alicyclobacillus macrosporangiidus]
MRSYPSKKAVKKTRAKVREELAPRNRLYWSPAQVVVNLNPIIQGWRSYYGSIDPGMSRRFLSKVDWHINWRLILYWRKKHKRNRMTPTEIVQFFRSIGLKTASGYGQGL